MSEALGRPENYNTIQQTDPEAQVNVTILRGNDGDGYPKMTSVWSGLPTWILILAEWLLGLGVTCLFAIVAALIWPVAAVYHHGMANTHRFVQHCLAVLMFMIGIILYGLTLAVFSVIGLALWIVWIINDINALSSHTLRPKLFNDYCTGLFTFAM